MRPKDTFFSRKQTINCRGKLVNLHSPLIMGIINITPDSFYGGSRTMNHDAVVEQVSKKIREGADIIDFGAYSSRPGAEHISEKEELDRLISVLGPVRKKFPEILISVDTFRAQVAQKMVSDFQVDIINDISAGNMDHNMLKTIADLQVPYILMHMKGTPQNMKKNAIYENLLKDIFYFFSEKIKTLTRLGVNDIIIDPGFGFGKTIEHNFQILQALNDFRIFELPILAGLSRKSMIYKTLDSDPEHALTGTIALNTLALENGANILRVHDVKEAKETIQLFLKYKNADLNEWHA